MNRILEGDTADGLKWIRGRRILRMMKGGLLVMMKPITLSARLLCVGVLFGAVPLLGVVLIGSNETAYAAESTLSLSISSPTVQADATPINANGTFSKATTSTITASTNNATGYTLSIAAPSNAGSDYNKLIHATDSTAKLNSISSPTTEEQYKALNATSYNNTWGYLPSKYCSDGTSSSCSTNTSFLPAPTTTGDILDQTTSANSTANTYTIGMGTRIDSTTKIGNYTNSFVVRLVANAIPYSIIYDDNVVSNMPTDVDTTTPSSTINIASNTPVRAGFRFLGWCTVVPTNNNGTDTCTGGTQYQPSAALTIDQTGTGNNFHFYAMWAELCAGQVKMQNLTSSSIATLLPNEHSTATVCDTRDEQTYTIAKLKDGKYWMVENLNLAGGTALSADDTDVTSAYISSFSTSNNLTKDGDTIKLPASDTAGFNTNNYSYVYNSGNTADCGASGQNTPCYSYYSWDAATLGSGRTLNTENTDAPYSICPKGWRLPTSRTTSATNWQTTSDFYQLAHQYGLDSTTSTIESDNGFYTQAGPGTTPSFLLAGLYFNDSFSNGGSVGYYWSSTSYSSTSYARYLDFGSSYVDSAYGSSRGYGFSVRCLFSGQ